MEKLNKSTIVIFLLSGCMTPTAFARTYTGVPNGTVYKQEDIQSMNFIETERNHLCKDLIGVLTRQEDKLKACPYSAFSILCSGLDISELSAPDISMRQEVSDDLYHVIYANITYLSDGLELPKAVNREIWNLGSDILEVGRASIETNSTYSSAVIPFGSPAVSVDKSTSRRFETRAENCRYSVK